MVEKTVSALGTVARVAYVGAIIGAVSYDIW